MTDSFHFVRYDKAYSMLVKLKILKIDQSSLIEIMQIITIKHLSNSNIKIK